MDKKWICFFSQTGSEIVEVSKRLGRLPDFIITNNNDKNKWCKEIKQDMWEERLFLIPSKPHLEDYKRALRNFSQNNTIITLHGFLRIIPEEICQNWEIYNGHPGRIWVDKTLKGYNAQEKAWKRGDKVGGSVIHKCTPELDGGEILAKRECSIENLTLDDTYKILHENSIELWVDFLKKKLI